MTKFQKRHVLIQSGIRNLKEFGYPDVTAENILTDRIYKKFFASMLEDNLGKGYDDAIKELTKEIGE